MKNGKNIYFYFNPTFSLSGARKKSLQKDYAVIDIKVQAQAVFVVFYTQEVV